jgi:sulfur carrier protein ThiS
MPQVELRLFGNLRSYLPPLSNGQVATVHVPEGSTLEDLVRQLGIPASEPKILLINGLHVERGQRLEEADRVSIFPPIAGG